MELEEVEEEEEAMESSHESSSSSSLSSSSSVPPVAKQMRIIGPASLGKIKPDVLRLLMKYVLVNGRVVPTEPGAAQEIIDGRLGKRKRGVYGPPFGCKAVLFIDDINMPEIEEYGAQPPVELIRQFCDFVVWSPEVLTVVVTSGHGYVSLDGSAPIDRSRWDSATAAASEDGTTLLPWRYDSGGEGRENLLVNVTGYIL